VSKLLLLLVAGMVLVSSAAAAAQQDYPVSATIRGENIWLRAEPAEDTEVLAYLQRGDQIEVTGDPTAADGDVFSPVDVVGSGETGWVRELAVDPRSFTSVATLPSVDVTTPAPVETTPQGEQPKRTRNRAAPSAPDAAAADRPARKNRARTTTPRTRQ
jgi:hypothetical protein